MRMTNTISYINAQYFPEQSYTHRERSFYSVSMATVVFVETSCIFIICNSPLIIVGGNEIAITRPLKARNVLRI
jgi:hypothetical protein